MVDYVDEPTCICTTDVNNIQRQYCTEASNLIHINYVIRIYLFPESKLNIRKLITINLPTGFYEGGLTRFVIEFNSSTIICKWPQIKVNETFGFQSRQNMLGTG